MFQNVCLGVSVPAWGVGVGCECASVPDMVWVTADVNLVWVTADVDRVRLMLIWYG